MTRNRFAALVLFCAATLLPDADARAQLPAPPDTARMRAAGEVMPAYIGDLGTYLSANLHYPDSARVHGQEGRAVLQFVVTPGGMLTDIKIVRSSGFPLLDAEALRVLQPMRFVRYWNPGMMKGEPVQVYFTLPISFHL